MKYITPLFMCNFVVEEISGWDEEKENVYTLSKLEFD
jgi:hypothetical protein